MVNVAIVCGSGHCFNHRLNLVLSKACSKPEVHIVFEIISQVIDFIYGSKVRFLRFTNMLKGMTQHRRLVKLCETRWIERHDAVIVFIELLFPVVVFLEGEEMTEGKSAVLLTAWRSSKFLIGCHLAEAVLVNTITPSTLLHSPEADLISAYKVIRDISQIFEGWGNDPETTFATVFAKTSETVMDIGGEITVPRQAGRQRHRANSLSHRQPLKNTIEDQYSSRSWISCSTNFENVSRRYQKCCTSKNC